MRFGVVALLLGGCVVGGGEGSWVFDGATGLRIELASGEVSVTPSEDGALRLAFDGGGIGQAARPEVGQEGGEVELLASDGLGGGEVDARVPPGIPIEVLLDSGEIAVELVAPADVFLCVATGSVDLVVPAGAYRLDLDVGVGSVAEEIVHDPDAEHAIALCAGAGDVTVRTADDAGEPPTRDR